MNEMRAEINFLQILIKCYHKREKIVALADELSLFLAFIDFIKTRHIDCTTIYISCFVFSFLIIVCISAFYMSNSMPKHVSLKTHL